ncbi:Os09g0242600 [Oryza sativa Japonica Group]|jgi:hypothetical protein|uniref:Os09g0242600 protein n=2 Tax=Oryza sativa subsp. japonica TaxID=39947 RepID=Q0J3A1_ORYSJ|nr:hypothetical protein DAI22_09g016400 [Oryza sativa Japonica Group]BAD23512.1 unknown protein [Oryza sativa Japonica Group]BAD23687.1 unknown protein [Oryza sativa Japonica Group]BAF24564.1 Os09g0242600 [Oryza sativa Japonica Group]BAT06997.1 Os09g0242600 [Oryza sativa Japonica Group]|eukprot:NP_001062650.1 Os09g0242600 [Oryza sativa Japonica Group]
MPVTNDLRKSKYSPPPETLVLSLSTISSFFLSNSLVLLPLHHPYQRLRAATSIPQLPSAAFDCRPPLPPSPIARRRIRPPRGQGIRICLPSTVSSVPMHHRRLRPPRVTASIPRLSGTESTCPNLVRQAPPPHPLSVGHRIRPPQG